MRPLSRYCCTPPDLPARVPGCVHDAAAGAGLLGGGRRGKQLATGRHQRRVFLGAAPDLPGDHRRREKTQLGSQPGFFFPVFDL